MVETERKAIICPVCGETVRQFLKRGTCTYKVPMNTEGRITGDIEYDNFQVDMIECVSCGSELDKSLFF